MSGSFIVLTIDVRHGDGQLDEVGMVLVFWSSVAEFGGERLSAHCTRHARLAQTWHRATQSDLSPSEEEAAAVPDTRLGSAVQTDLVMEASERGVMEHCGSDAGSVPDAHISCHGVGRVVGIEILSGSLFMGLLPRLTLGLEMDFQGKIATDVANEFYWGPEEPACRFQTRFNIKSNVL